MQKIFFFPHPNLRDRQLDTIRLWPKDQVINPEVAQQKPYHYSAQATLRKFIPKNWYQYIPVINFKRRPKSAPADAIVFCWGGVITHGDFIIELDNPYVMTGYNVGALRLYAPILRMILLSRRCREIRCISQACRDTLRHELGDAVADKARVVYPKISDLDPAHTPQPVSGTPQLLFISTNFIIKAGPSVLRVMKRLQDNHINCHLTMITHLPEEYKAEAAALTNTTIIPASLPRSELVKYYSRCDIMLHPTFVESFGMVVMEAIARGMAMIATDVYALKEMVIDGKNGRLLTPPIAIWHGILPAPYISDYEKTRNEILKTDMRQFEDQLYHAIVETISDPARCTEYKNFSFGLFKKLTGL